MNEHNPLPIGKHPVDSPTSGIDVIGHSLERLQTFLLWIEEHCSSFEDLRQTDPVKAENELACLRDATEQAIVHLQRLTELLLAGHFIDPKKRLPKGLSSEIWLRTAQVSLQEHFGTGNMNASEP